MPSRNDYELLDFGGGRKLERFGAIVLDRPCPAVEGIRPAAPDAWAGADARFEGRNEEKGAWACRRELPEQWIVARGPLRFELKRTDFGHVGLFPEQAENWKWIAGQVRRSGVGGKEEGGGKLKVLNLFAYTGGSTMAAAAGGAEVVHVDAAKNIVAWARRNAELSGLATAPIRWIVEDALKFVERELRRGNGYDAVILDPPSYGHGPRGQTWQIEKHLPRLLNLCGELLADRAAFMLLSCHTPGYDAAALKQMLADRLGGLGKAIDRTMYLQAADGRMLPCGAAARWSG